MMQKTKWKELVKEEVISKDNLNARKITKVEVNDNLEVSNARNSQIKTLDQLLSAAEVDLEKWEVERYVANVWNVFSNATGHQDLWQVKANLKKKLVTKVGITELLEACIEESKSKIKISKPPSIRNGKMIEIAIPDLHLGKFCWEKETGTNYDTKIAVVEYKKAFLDLLGRVGQAEEGWLVIGNDFFNVDNALNQTTGGTPQDEDGRNKKTFEIGVQLMVWATTVLLTKVSRVKLIVVAGNHDEERAFFLGTTLAAWYRKDKNVIIDNEPKPHKIYTWGATLIGFTHGDRISKQNLAGLLPNLARDKWGKTKHAELHLGHLHHNMVLELLGTTIRWLSSLTAPDKWHNKGGYITAARAASIFEYSKKGLLAIHNYNID